MSSSQDILLKVSKTTSSQELFDYDCVTLYKPRPYRLKCMGGHS